jgi:hypothetical protein
MKMKQKRTIGEIIFPKLNWAHSRVVGPTSRTDPTRLARSIYNRVFVTISHDKSTSNFKNLRVKASRA